MDRKTMAIIAVVVILIAAIGVGLFLTQNKTVKPVDTKAPVNTTNTTVTNTTQNVTNTPTSNDYYIDEDGEREYYDEARDDMYDRD